MRGKSMRWLGGLATVALLAAACGGTPSSTASSNPSSSPVAAASSTPSPTAKLFIPMISKGFQHQFWQAVRQGAEKAAAQYNVTITFEGPENESQVDKQIERPSGGPSNRPSSPHGARR